MCEICSKITINIPKQRYWSSFGVFIFNFEHVLSIILMFAFLTLHMQLPVGSKTILPENVNYWNHFAFKKITDLKIGENLKNLEMFNCELFPLNNFPVIK